jgi:putative ABC transport system permease protein
MKLALRELVRRPGRFATATVILTLIAVLLMFLGGLLDGLIRESTGAIRAQSGELIVYSDTAQASFQRSRIEPDTRAAIDAVPGVSATGGIGVAQLGARVPGNGPRDLASVALFGYEIAPVGVPEPPADGEAWADDILKADGVEVGDELLLGPARSPVTVVGFVSETPYNSQGSLWATPATWREVLSANRPDAQVADDVFQSLVVEVDGDAAVVAAAIDAATGSTETFTIDGAIAAIPGVEEQQATFNQIIGVTVVIGLVVIALFFALLTVERTGLYGVLKAHGARTGTIFAGVVAQAVALTLVAAVVAGGLALLLDAVIPPGSIPLLVTPSRIITSTLLLLVAAIVGCAFSLRRVLRIDPASAIGSGT